MIVTVVMLNVSVVGDDTTARTHPDCARQRAENLAVFGVTNVLELCVGPSLATLEQEYARFGITVTGNDIDQRWKRYHPTGRWIIGDALRIDYTPFDAVVFAPPLSRGCTGHRQDSLSIDQVVPRYRDFLVSSEGFRGLVCLVLPARSTATELDRRQLYALLSMLSVPFDVVSLSAGRRAITKYHDVYVRRT
jgi:hypothetical protein